MLVYYLNDKGDEKMKNNDNYGLLNSLFTAPSSTIAREVNEENTKKSLTTQRTWKIRNELWDDFTALVATSGMTQAEYVNKLIEQDIEQNRERIEKYREMIGKKQ